MATNRTHSTFEQLPTVIHTEIIWRLAKISRRAVRNLLIAMPTLSRAANAPLVHKHLNLYWLTVNPRATITRYHQLMNCCLAARNLQAHYVRGIIEYFGNNNLAGGLGHFLIAAEGSFKPAVYLYGIIKLCSGEPEVGQAMLDSLGWVENKARVDNCWKRIKQSLHGTTVTQLPSYTAAYVNTRATITCHPDNVEARCDNCFYYKQITKFTFMM